MNKKEGTLYLSYYNVLSNIHEQFENPHVYSVATSIPPGCEKFITEHFKSLAPSSDFKDYKEGSLNYKDFKLNYIRKIKSSRESLASLRRIKQELKEGHDVFLICYEKDYQVCHRFILGRLLLGEEFLNQCRIYPADSEISEYVDLKHLAEFIQVLDDYMVKYEEVFSNHDRQALNVIKKNLEDSNVQFYFKTKTNSSELNGHMEFTDLANFIGNSFMDRQWLLTMKKKCTELLTKEQETLNQEKDMLLNSFLSDKNIDSSLEKMRKRYKAKNKTKVGIDYIDNSVKFNKKIKDVNLTDNDLDIINKASEEYGVQYDTERALFLKRLGEKFRDELIAKEGVIAYPVLCPLAKGIVLVLFTTSEVEWLHEVYKDVLKRVSEYWGDNVVFTTPSSREEERELLELGYIGVKQKREGTEK